MVWATKTKKMLVLWEGKPQQKFKIYPGQMVTATAVVSGETWPTIAPGKPLDLWVECVKPSSYMTDTKLRLYFVTGGPQQEIPLQQPPQQPIQDEGEISQTSIDLDIWDGQEVPPQAPVPEADERGRGAFTVANCNDTNGDGIKDCQSTMVVATDPTKGRNEVDLMKLVINVPQPSNLPGYVELAITVEEEGKTKIWEKPTKETIVNLPATFNISDLPKTLWVEGTTCSATLRDVELRIDYHITKDAFVTPDTVNATYVWAEVTAVSHDSSTAATLLANPIWSDMTTPPANILQVVGGT